MAAGEVSGSNKPLDTNRQREVKVTIASGQSISGPLDCAGLRPVAIHMPAGWDAADITVQVYNRAIDAYGNLYDKAGTEYAIKAAASRYIPLPATDFAGVDQLKLRSGTASAAVNQTADRDIVVVLRSVS